jgi:hypothetical protein
VRTGSSSSASMMRLQVDRNMFFYGYFFLIFLIFGVYLDDT